MDRQAVAGAPSTVQQLPRMLLAHPSNEAGSRGAIGGIDVNAIQSLPHRKSFTSASRTKYGGEVRPSPEESGFYPTWDATTPSTGAPAASSSPTRHKVQHVLRQFGRDFKALRNNPSALRLFRMQALMPRCVAVLPFNVDTASHRATTCALSLSVSGAPVTALVAPMALLRVVAPLLLWHAAVRPSGG